MNTTYLAIVSAVAIVGAVWFKYKQLKKYETLVENDEAVKRANQHMTNIDSNNNQIELEKSRQAELERQKADEKVKTTNTSFFIKYFGNK